MLVAISFECTLNRSISYYNFSC